MDDDAKAVAEEYFRRVREGDLSVVDLFHDDATLAGVGPRRAGRAEILDFYRGVIERAGPAPRPAGDILCQGARAAAEIYIDLPGGAVVHAVDLFLVEAGRIRSLSYFLCAAG